MLWETIFNTDNRQLEKDWLVFASVKTALSLPFSQNRKMRDRKSNCNRFLYGIESGDKQTTKELMRYSVTSWIKVNCIFPVTHIPCIYNNPCVDIKSIGIGNFTFRFKSKYQDDLILLLRLKIKSKHLKSTRGIVLIISITPHTHTHTLMMQLLRGWVKSLAIFWYRPVCIAYVSSFNP